MYVKLVVTSATSVEELCTAAEIVKQVDPGIPMVLQPVTARGGVRAPSPSQVLAWQAECAERLHNVLVIPQCHRMLGQL